MKQRISNLNNFINENRFGAGINTYLNLKDGRKNQFFTKHYKNWNDSDKNVIFIIEDPNKSNSYSVMSATYSSYDNPAHWESYNTPKDGMSLREAENVAKELADVNSQIHQKYYYFKYHKNDNSIYEYIGVLDNKELKSISENKDFIQESKYDFLSQDFGIDFKIDEVIKSIERFLTKYNISSEFLQLTKTSTEYIELLGHSELFTGLSSLYQKILLKFDRYLTHIYEYKLWVSKDPKGNSGPIYEKEIQKGIKYFLGGGMEEELQKFRNSVSKVS